MNFYQGQVYDPNERAVVYDTRMLRFCSAKDINANIVSLVEASKGGNAKRFLKLTRHSESVLQYFGFMESIEDATGYCDFGNQKVEIHNRISRIIKDVTLIAPEENILDITRSHHIEPQNTLVVLMKKNALDFYKNGTKTLYPGVSYNLKNEDYRQMEKEIKKFVSHARLNYEQVA